MHVFFHIFGKEVPAYGLLIVLGTFIANAIGAILIKKDKREFDDLLLIEAYCILFGFAGAKILYLLVSIRDIDWSRFFEMEYFSSIMQGGFVFYGGLIGGLGGALLASKLHKLDLKYFIKKCIFLIPFIHSFGRIGCFCAGCCYGIPYHGSCAVVFPEGSFAIPGVELFPVQLVESGMLMVIAMILFVLVLLKKNEFNVELYLILYAIVRFILENYRYDPERGQFFGFSTSQWISMIMLLVAIVSITMRIIMKKKKPVTVAVSSQTENGEPEEKMKAGNTEEE